MLLLQEKGWKEANSIPLILDRERKEQNQGRLTVTDISVESKRHPVKQKIGKVCMHFYY